MAGDRVFSVQTSVAISCDDNSREPCELKMSVRNSYVAVRVDGGDEWAHMTPDQARRLAKWLCRGADEAEERRAREGRWRASRMEAKHGR